MAKGKVKRLPKFSSLDKLVEFVDSHDLGDYEASMPKVDFDIDIKHRTYLIRLDNDVSHELMKLAVAKKKSSTKLVNSWIRKRIKEEKLAV